LNFGKGKIPAVARPNKKSGGERERTCKKKGVTSRSRKKAKNDNEFKPVNQKRSRQKRDTLPSKGKK